MPLKGKAENALAYLSKHYSNLKEKSISQAATTAGDDCTGRWKPAQINMKFLKFRTFFIHFQYLLFQDECYKHVTQCTALVFCLVLPQDLNLDFHILHIHSESHAWAFLTGALRQGEPC